LVTFIRLTFGKIKEYLNANGTNHYISKPTKLTESKNLLKQYFKAAAEPKQILLERYKTNLDFLQNKNANMLFLPSNIFC
jgi:hypothetical protein